MRAAGNPLEREPEKVLDDVLRGFVSPEAAQTEYGVVVRGKEVSIDETKSLRETLNDQNSQCLESNGQSFQFGFNDLRQDFENIWTESNYSVLMDAIWRLPVDWRFFVKHQVFARMSRLDKNEITGNGNEVQRILEEVASEYPDVSRALIPQ